MNSLVRSIYVGIVLWSLSAISGAWILYAAGSVLHLSWNYNGNHSYGVFNTSGGGWNAWGIKLIQQSEEAGVGGSWVYIDTTGPIAKFVGNIWIETVWWAEMIDVSPIASWTYWTLSGYAWSPNAWYIDFEAQDNSYSGVTYIPGKQSFTGHAWSENLGFIGFGSGENLDFKNKVKILGNIGWSRVFDTEYYIGTRFDSQNATPVLNSIRKNIALLTRNLPPTKVNSDNTETKVINNMMYYEWVAAVNAVNTKLDGGDARSLIVKWWDIIISSDVVRDMGVNSPRALIALKDDNGNGGNIYIQWGVKNIYSSLVAEGSIYSGDSSANIYNDTTVKISSLPKSQLYIYGTVISRNTIGWASLTTVVCPFTESACTSDAAFKYDWNYFRTFDRNAMNRSDKSGYDTYSVIIESDTEIVEDPPPGIDL